MQKKDTSRNVIFLVIVAALGYFVDIYDLVLFSVVRIKSFHDIGVSADDMLGKGQFVINMQMAGLLVGGIIWGILGDKFGRIKVLFGSILLYSLANFANGFATDVNTYAIIRLIAGIGLAGELGAGITLVSETMSKENRGYGTMIVAGVGLFGAVAAATVAKNFAWQTSYFVGGGLGILLLLLRVGTFESGMFKVVEKSGVTKGDMRMLFTSRKRFWKYLCCILIGMPLWYVVGILVTLSPEFGKELGAVQPLSAGTGIMYTYIGIAIGDILAGLLAQITRSRKLTMLVFLLVSVVSMASYLSAKNITPAQFIGLSLFMGISVGYWATFVTIASEQFGTNIRSTVTTTVPNFVRGALIPITFAFNAIVSYFVSQEKAKGITQSTALIHSGYVMMALLTIIALFALSQLKESFGKDLDYVEQ
ncbi:MFS transporter [Mucilaginibacter paludis]|uniref:Major facilitator superfamily MFS_1 n=1 Tax=Mucilaginibacter paludis DSM 18603 TaxID=714943 RepID=H1YDP7_9SPHI|nr:MFS transporter [Mucilaginibacter paludis]EHQ30736.1 major facilitator superfamily MFS_1 [Mucilaginibacter paludis DSM 18603]